MATACVLLLAGCTGGGPRGSTVVTGRAVAMLYDPGRVGGLPATDGASGPRGEVPPVTTRVQGSDDGPIDRLALAAVDDVEQFWTEHYAQSLPGTFTPVANLVSYDSTDPASPPVCGNDAYGFRNAMYCHRADTMAWDRGKFLPTARKYFGDMAINGVIAHEYGHALQYLAGLVHPLGSSLVYEQQADCFAGVYLQWVAAGSSPRAALSTGDGLNHVLAGLIVTRDPISAADSLLDIFGDAHGTALDRVGAFQIGFDGGAEMCARIDRKEIRNRRGDLPSELFDSRNPQSDTVIDESILAMAMAQLGRIFTPAQPPTLSTSGGACPADPVAYCAATNTVVVDLPALQAMSTPSDPTQRDLPQGDNTGLSAVISRYTLAVQQQRGVALDSAAAALRTACLTGVAQRRMTEHTDAPGLILGGGDLDEAVTGLLMNGIAASDVNGMTVPAGFTRILAYRSGLHSDTDECFGRFP